jgi:ADP-ribose pyrophosphatase
VAHSDPSDYTEHEVNSTLVYDGGLLKVRSDVVRLPDGKTSQREYVHHPGAVIIVALLDDQTVIMERQFRYPLRRHFLELPAGKIEPNEDALVTAQRELIEECGYEAGNWRHLATLHPCIGYSDERIELYLARDLKEVSRALDDGEFLDVVPMPIADVWRGINDGSITDIKVLAGLAWLKAFLP